MSFAGVEMMTGGVVSGEVVASLCTASAGVLLLALSFAIMMDDPPVGVAGTPSGARAPLAAPAPPGEGAPAAADPATIALN